MPLIDPTQVATSTVTMVIGGVSSWLGLHILRVVRDMRAIFDKIRMMEERLNDISETLYGPDGPQGDNNHGGSYERGRTLAPRKSANRSG